MIKYHCTAMIFYCAKKARKIISSIIFVLMVFGLGTGVAFASLTGNDNQSFVKFVYKNMKGEAEKVFDRVSSISIPVSAPKESHKKNRIADFLSFDMEKEILSDKFVNIKKYFTDASNQIPNLKEILAKDIKPIEIKKVFSFNNGGAMVAGVFDTVSGTIKNFIFTRNNQSDQGESGAVSPVYSYTREEVDKIVKNKTEEIRKEILNLKSQVQSSEGNKTIINQPVSERVVEKIIETKTQVSGISQNELEERLLNLNTSLLNRISQVESNANTQTTGVYRAVSLTNRINNLSNITVSGVTGLTDSDIPDTITVSNYLPLSGGAVTGNLTVDTSTLVVDSANDRVGIGTTSPTDTFSLNGAAFLANISAPSVTTNRLYSSSGNLYWNGSVIGGGIGNWTLSGSDVYYTTGNVGIGTTSPAWKLSVAGIGSFDDYVRASYFTATSTAATSTFSGGLSAAYFNQTGNTATSTFSTGIDLASGCFAINGVCVGTGASSQWTTSGSDVYYTTGNVGIGTTSPYRQFSVGNNAVFGGDVIASYFTATSTTASIFPYASTTALTISGSTYLTNLGQGWLHTAGGTNALTSSSSPTVNYITATSTTATSTFATGGLTVGTSQFVVQQTSGNVGIGTTEPYTNFHIYGNNKIFRIGSGNVDGDNFSSTIELAEHTNTDGTFRDGAKIGNIGTNGQERLFLHTFFDNTDIGGIDIMKADGNVGIGTTSPYAKLSVVGETVAKMFTATSTTATSTFPYLAVTTNSNLGTVVGGTWQANAIGAQYGGTGQDFSASSGLVNFYSGTASAIATSSLGLLTTNVAEGSNLYWTTDRFDTRLAATTTLPNLTTLLGLTNASTTLLTVSSNAYFPGSGIWDSSGSVGIGTTSPNWKLSVAGIGSFDDYVRASYFTATSTTATSSVAGVFSVGSTTPAANALFSVGTSSPLFFIDKQTGNIGVGTLGGSARRFEVLDVANPQLRLSQDSTTYTDFTVAPSTGDLTIGLYPSGSADDIILTMPGGSTGANLWVCEGTACPSANLTGGGNIFVEGGITYATSTTPKTRRSIILTSAGAIPPTTSGAAKTQVDGTNHSYYVLDFDASSDEAAYWQWTMPDSYDDGVIDVTYYWEAGATSGDTIWCFQSIGLASNNSEDIDTALGAAVCETDTAQGNANDLASITETNATSNFVAGDYVAFKVFRDADAGGDTMTGDARLVKVKIEYGVDQESD